MLTRNILKREYARKHVLIKSRLSEFNKAASSKGSGQKFLELCFCLCTPQSKAVRVASVINEKNLQRLMRSSREDVAAMLRTNARFHNNKAGYIVSARKFIKDIESLSKDPIMAREYLVAHIKGLGYKEASHFLRNIGYRDICIIDRHIVNLLYELGVFPIKEMPKSARQYLAMEQKIKDFSCEIGIDVDELDLLLWSIKAGIVFK